MKLDRLNEMEHYIYCRGNVSLEELAEHFGVSVNTVRRDIVEIMKNDTIRKVYGGVVSRPEPELVPRTEREKTNRTAKQTIGMLAAERIADYSTVFLDTGTTIARIIPYLANKQNLTIITASLPVIEQATQYPNLNIFTLGGFFNKEISGFVGITVTEYLNRLAFDTAIVSAAGITDKSEMTIDGFYEEPIKRQVLARGCRDVTLVADTEKFGRSALFSFGTLSDIQCIISEQKPPEPYLSRLQDMRIKTVYPNCREHQG